MQLQNIYLFVLIPDGDALGLNTGKARKPSQFALGSIQHILYDRTLCLMETTMQNSLD
jgi:hypothetical protein